MAMSEPDPIATPMSAMPYARLAYDVIKFALAITIVCF